MVGFQSEKFKVSFDDETGYVREIINVQDKNQTNWVLQDYDWGKVEGFDIQNIEFSDNKLVVNAVGTQIDSLGLSLKIERVLSNKGYSEKYIFTNKTQTDFFATQETFGIHLPFYSYFKPGVPLDKQISQNCIAHVWCGYNICWICGKKIDGSGEKLFINMSSGDVSDYSIERDISKVRGSDARGSIVLNPAPFILGENEKKSFEFEYYFTNEPLEDLIKQKNYINVYANTYSAFLCETINFTAECKDKIKSAKVISDNQEVSIVIEDNKITWDAVGTTIGEQRFDVYINDKHTYTRVIFIEDLNTILEKRAYFIAKNHQFLKKGSRLDGAYLIYDDVQKKQFYSDSFFDRNSARERIALGVIVLRQLQKKNDEFLMKSIEKHLEFIEREHFDSETGTPFDHIGRNNNNNRVFNYPWFAVYFKEWYLLTHDVEYLKRAAHSLIGYYNTVTLGRDGQLAEPLDIIDLLKRENQNDLADILIGHLLRKSEDYINYPFGIHGTECAYVQERPCNRGVYASQAYLLSGDEKYLLAAKKQKNIAEAFYACQPDYHMNGISVRQWDRFWFGKKRQYGDLYPHHWSALMGWMYGWYEKASGEDCRNIRDEILKNNLCIYRNDGFASNNYLYPYKINMYALDPNHNDKFRPTGCYYGKCYDEWSNDQDWALYLADYFMNRNFDTDK